MDKIMDKVKELQDKLFEKRADYVVVDRTLGLNNENEPYERWNIYTPDISHNNFENRAKFVEFLERLVSDDVFYRTRNIEKIKDSIETTERHIREYQDSLVRLKSDLQQIEKGE